MMKSKQDLDAWYAQPDPWGYATHPDDSLRMARFLASLPGRQYQRAIDIGCGNGFLTRAIPADTVLGVDVSEKAIAYATDSVRKPNVRFEAASLFDLSADRLGPFDLIVVTGLLYPEYVGSSYHLAERVLRDLARPGGVVISCHIAEWRRRSLPFSLLRKTLYRYREYTHCLEVFAVI